MPYPASNTPYLARDVYTLRAKYGVFEDLLLTAMQLVYGYCMLCIIVFVSNVIFGCASEDAELNFSHRQGS